MNCELQASETPTSAACKEPQMQWDALDRHWLSGAVKFQNSLTLQNTRLGASLLVQSLSTGQPVLVPNETFGKKANNKQL